ncbi:type II toxin-antitoxin system RelE/ParE family toxin [Thermodesulfobacteriota bacterium]
MSWKIEVKPTAEKYYLKLDKKTRTRMKEALGELENTDDPILHPNVRALTGKLRGDFRLRVGKWRVLFTPHIEKKILYVFAIVPRGDTY